MGDSILSTNQRERERQIKNISRVARGGKVEKKIYVQMEDLDEKKKRQEQVKLDREKKNKRSDALKDARTPWFCPSCKKVMNKRLDDKMYRLYGHCFDCQVKFENKLRIEGKYEDWERGKVLKNKLSWIKEQRETIEQFKKQKAPEFYQQFRPDGYSVDKEKWDIDKSFILEQAEEALDYLKKMEDSLK